MNSASEGLTFSCNLESVLEIVMQLQRYFSSSMGIWYENTELAKAVMEVGSWEGEEKDGRKELGGTSKVSIRKQEEGGGG